MIGAQSSSVRFIVAWLVFSMAAFLWQKGVTAIAIWWMVHHPPTLPPGVDTSFMKHVWIAWLLVILPLFPFAIWIWQLPTSRADNARLAATHFGAE